VVRLFVRHEKIESLEKLKEVSLHVRNAMSGVTQDLYTSHIGLLKGTGKKSGSKTVQKNATATYFLHPINEDKLPKGAAAGHFLVGELSLFKDSAASKVDTHRIFYNLNNVGGGAAKKEKATANKSKKDDAKAKKTEEEKLKEAIRDAQVPYVAKINEIYETLRHEYENHVPIYINRIQFLESQISAAGEADNEKKIALWDELLSTARIATEKINQDELLKFLGEKTNDSVTDEAKKYRILFKAFNQIHTILLFTISREFESQKGWIIDLLVHQGVALIEKDLLATKNAERSALTDRFSTVNEELRKVYKSLQKWVDINDDKVFKTIRKNEYAAFIGFNVDFFAKVSRFTVKFYQYNSLNGKALKILFKQSEDKPSKPIDQSILNVHIYEFQKIKLFLPKIKFCFCC
jgi:tripeptidyl-peptidase-2